MTSSDQKLGLAASITAIGLGLAVGGMVACAAGHKAAGFITAGFLTCGVAAVPAVAGEQQRQKEHAEYVASLRGARS